MSTSTRKYHPGDVPERVIAAARSLLATQTATEISMRELARTADVSHAAPYRHFGDRAGFLIALAAHCFGEFIEEQQKAFDTAEPGERLYEVGLAYVNYATNHRYAFALIFDPAISPGSDPPPSHLPLIDAHTHLLAAALEDAITTGRLPADKPPLEIGYAMWSAAHGLANLVTAGRLIASDVPATLAALLTEPSPTTAARPVSASCHD